MNTTSKEYTHAKEFGGISQMVTTLINTVAAEQKMFAENLMK